MTKPDLDAAYGLQTPEDSKKLYADWAKTYDDGFVAGTDYRLPQLVALILTEVIEGQGPVLDVGAGTGQVAQHFPLRGSVAMDALDISPDMLAVATRKGLYRSCIIGDLTGRLDIPDDTYGALVSSGTFTHGHVGPDALEELLRIARRGAVFVLAVNAAHFEARGFAAKFAQLATRITDLDQRMVNIYGPDAPEAHRDDQAQVAVFRKA